MITISIRRTVFPLIIILIGYLVAGCSPAKNIVVGEELSTNSDQWVAKTKGSGAMRRTQFGNFNMVSYEKIDSPLLRSKSQPGFLHLWNDDIVVKKRRAYRLIVADDKTEARILVFIWNTKTDSESGIFTLDKQDGPVSDLKEARGEIRFSQDDSAAFFEINSFAGTSLYSRDYFTPVTGLITYRTDTFRFKEVLDYQDGRPGFGHKISKGIIVHHPTLGKVAAFQLVGDPNIWMLKNLPAKTQLLIASAFSVLLGSRDM
jgi:hypothetical protein